jgi:hypothetical protein
MHLEEINLLTSREKRNGRCAGGGPELKGRVTKKWAEKPKMSKRNSREIIEENAMDPKKRPSFAGVRTTTE